MSNDKISIELSRAEALVLFEFVWRFSQDEKLDIVDQSEARVLWNVCASLEKILTEPFDQNYDDLLAAARDEVLDKDNG